MATLTSIESEQRFEQSEISIDQSDASFRDRNGLKKDEKDELTTTGETLSTLSSLCPTDALRVTPGFNSLKNAFENAKTNNIHCIYLENGIHQIEIHKNSKDEDCNILDIIGSPFKIIGENLELCIIVGGLRMISATDDDAYMYRKAGDVYISNLTVRESTQCGIFGYDGASFHLDTVCIDNSGSNGVSASGTKCNTMTFCEISNSKGSGLSVCDGGLITITDANPGSIHHNCTSFGNFNAVYNYGKAKKKSYASTVGNFGMQTEHQSFIHIESPLTKEIIATNNGAGRNYGGFGKIKINNGCNDGTKQKKQ